MAYNFTPMITAAAIITMNNRKGSVCSYSNDDGFDHLFWCIFGPLFFLIFSFLVVLLICAITKVETTTTLPVTVISARVFESGKYHTEYVAFKLRTDTGKEWEATETIRFSKCRKVVIPQRKLVWYHSRETALTTKYYYVSGLTTFCQG